MINKIAYGCAKSFWQYSQNKLISHIDPISSLAQIIKDTRVRLSQQWQILTPAQRDFRMEIFEEIITMPVFQNLMMYGGLNGKSTEYILSPDAWTKQEQRYLSRIPLIRATNERAKIFREQNQLAITAKNSEFATIPSGSGHELNLDYSKTQASSINLYFIDLDPEAVHYSKFYAQEKIQKNDNRIQFLAKTLDAWELSKHYFDKFNLISSNGLTIYESSNERILDLFHQFYNALQDKGILVTSFISMPNQWNLSEVDPEHLQLQQILFKEIIAVNFQNYQRAETMLLLLKQAGFKDIQIFSGYANIFPTVVATR